MKHFELYNLCVQHLNSLGAEIHYFNLVQDIMVLDQAELDVIAGKIAAGTFFDESGEIIF